MVALVVTVAVFATACTDKSPSAITVAGTNGPNTTIEASAATVGTSSPQTGNGGQVLSNPTGKAPRLFKISLSEGSVPNVVNATNAVVTGDELDPQRVKELLAKLPAWDDPTTLTTPFAFPTQSSPPPRTGKTVDVPFPPVATDEVPAVENGPLTVIRVQPEGAVPLAPYVAVTFNQPMVAVGTVAQVAPAEAPVKLDPAIPGRWQWIGTRTLRFDADSSVVDRLPMATTFTATVPAGTRSATGTALVTAQTFTFSTPAPVVVSFGPQQENVNLTPVFFAAFDQRIDQPAVLASISLITSTGESASVPVRLATKIEIEADEFAKNLVAGSQKGRWIAFRPVRALTTDTAFTVNIGPKTPSAEGPLTTDAAQSFSGKTYGPLKVKQVSCSYGEECPPGSDLYVEFTNQLDKLKSSSVKVTISPALVAQQITVDGGVSIQGATQARTKYTINLPAGLTDIYGQTLGTDQAPTITIGAARPSLRQLQLVTTLDPFDAAQKLSVLSTNRDELRVRIFEADPSKFGTYTDYASSRDDRKTKLPNWKVLSDSKFRPKGERDRTIESLIDLSKALNGKPGQVIVLIEPLPAVSAGSDNYWENRPILSWVQSTTMAVDSFTDSTEMRVWATDLRTGAPLSGIEIGPSSGTNTTTNGEGLATLTLPAASGLLTSVRATRGTESFILPVSAEQQVNPDSLRWYAFDDRQIYRPGETMKVKGWVRRIDGKTNGLSVAGEKEATYTVVDGFGVELTKGTTKLGALGGFDISIDLPKTANVGPAYLQMMPASGSELGQLQHQFEIAEFRRPEFEVKVEPVSTEPFISTSPVTMSIQASYFAGGPLPSAPVAWIASTTETTFSPIGWDKFTFGIFRPWWWGSDFGFEGEFSYRSNNQPSDVKQYTGVTDASGRHALQLKFVAAEGVLPDLPVSVLLSGTVTDVNRQAWADQSSLLVHSANRYVGLRSDRTFVLQGDPMNIQAVATDIDGKPQPGSKLNVSAGLLRTDYVDNKLVETIVDPQVCAITTGNDPVPCVFKTPVGGQYRVTSTVTDANGGRNRTELSVWVSGATSEPTRGVDRETVTLIPDKAEYSGGDTAKLLVQAPFATGEGLVFVTRNGVRETIRFALVKGSAQISVNITEADVPSIAITVEVVGATNRTSFDGKLVEGAPKRPAYAVGTLSLSVPPVKRTLKVTATPAVKELEPGESTSLAVTVNDSSGAPVVGAEFAVVVVDEAVLGLTQYQLPNPIDLFYQGGYSNVSTMFGRDQVQLVDPAALAATPQPGGSDGVVDLESAPAETTAQLAEAPSPAAPAKSSLRRNSSFADSDAKKGGAQPITVRSNFDALALFMPEVRTDANGKATVEVKLPDNLTRYRVMVVAASGADRFGTAESNLTARLPLSVRPSAPRFLNTGDAFELPVVVENVTNKAVDVDVVVQTANLDIVGPSGRRVTVPANDRLEVRFPVKVRSAGTAKFRVTAVGLASSDSAEQSIPVFTPGTSEAFATYGTIDTGGVRQPLLAPTEVIESYGGLEITTSSTSLQALTDALLYIDDYDYESSDAYASRIMSIGALRDVLKDFETRDLPSAEELNAAVERDIIRLVALQNDDGGFPYWRRYFDESAPYNSIQATHALVLAKNSGYTVSATSLDRALEFITDIESHIPSYYSDNERDTLRAYAIWVQALAGNRQPAKALALFSERGEKLNLDSLAWIWGSIDNPAAKASIERTITNSAVDTAGAVSFTSGYNDGEYLTLGSDQRTDALVLDALIANAPKSDLIEKVVAGLLAHKTKGRWNNAQENTFALLAFKRYYDTYESVTPDFVAKAWLGNQFAGQRDFRGRSIDRSRINIPMSELVNGGNRDIVVVKDGAGRLYYRIGLKYVPADLTLDALDRGFVVDRTYEGVDNKADVTRDADGTWRIKAGAKVRIKLTMVAESQRTHVALIDPLPAGLEALNPSLAVTQPVVGSEGSDAAPKYYWWGAWYQYQQFRDDRSEAFTTFLPAGVYDYSYIARATTPGSFVVPPTRAEEMYAPETFGRTATDRVIVE